MKNSRELWLRGAWKWWLPLAFLVVNTALLVIYLWTFAGRVGALEESYQQGERDLEQMAEARESAADFLASVETQDQSVETLYKNYFSTEPRRFTTAVKEVKALAARARLSPTSLNYPREVDEDNGLVHRNVNFSVKGTYDDLRNFINFLELTDQFLTLESISLSTAKEQRDARLGIRLSLSTMFAEAGDEETEALGSDAKEDAAASEDEEAEAPEGGGLEGGGLEAEDET